MIELHKPQRDIDPTQQQMAERVTIMFQTPEVLAELRDFKPEDRDVLVGRCVEYVAIGLDVDNLPTYLNSVKAAESQNIHELYDTAHGFMIDQLIHELGLSELEDSIVQQRLFDHLTERLVVHGSFYHGFNGVFEDSIRSNGLSAENRAWDWEELDKIQELFKSIGRSKILGWAGVNSKNNVFVTENPSGVFRYATGSPEWFAQFTGESHYFPPEPPYDKQAFARRDYEAARKNIMSFCQGLMNSSEEDIKQGRAYRNLTIDEVTEVLSFFDTYWQRFTGPNSEPRMALVQRKAISANTPPYDSYNDFQDTFREFGEYPPLGIYIQQISQRNDLRVGENIASEMISIANLPAYNEIFPSQVLAKRIGSSAIEGSLKA
jgi:hypothetical protein